MSPRPLPLAVALCAAATLLAPAAGAATAAAAEPLRRDHLLGGVDPRVAETLAWESCAGGAADCRVVESQEGHLRLLAPADVQRRFARRLAEVDAQSHAVDLRLDLLAPGRGGLPSGLPSGAAAALRDAGQHLGVAGFQRVDTALLRTARGGLLRLRGPGDQPYQLDLEVAPAAGLDPARVEIRQVSLTALPPAVRGAGPPPPVQPGRLLQSSLGLDRGETVVVGTVRLDDAAPPLVLLLTADP